jgi:hypothetical protein
LQDVVVPEAQHFPAKAVQIGCSLMVGVEAVLTAIGLDNDPALGTPEVGDAAADGLLLFELETAEPTTAQVVPQSAFGVRCVTPKRSRVRVGSTDRRHDCVLEEGKPSPNPLP